ncbi:MAG: hypothetical protein KY468_02705 [Armatimonadetes bacterium]|nr:hypothetical protein [Armatimonadota bacterium]
MIEAVETKQGKTSPESKAEYRAQVKPDAKPEGPSQPVGFWIILALGAMFWIALIYYLFQ